MVFSPYISASIEPRSFKQRFGKTNANIQIMYGDSLVFFKKAGTVDSVYFRVLKKSFKDFFKKNKIATYSFFKPKIWFFIHSNYPLTKKSKNARMGKGKGGFIRWTIRLKKNNRFFETRNLSIFFIKLLLTKLQFKLNIPLQFYKPNRNQSRRNKFTWYI